MAPAGFIIANWTDPFPRWIEHEVRKRRVARNAGYAAHARALGLVDGRDRKRALVQQLTADLTKRLGNLKAGADDVKKHKWFTACTPPTNFEALLAGKGEAPIKARRAARAMRHTNTRRAALTTHGPPSPPHSLQAPIYHSQPVTPSRLTPLSPPHPSYAHSPRLARARATPLTSMTTPTRRRAVRSRAIRGTTSSLRTSDQRCTTVYST